MMKLQTHGPMEKHAQSAECPHDCAYGLTKMCSWKLFSLSWWVEWCRQGLPLGEQKGTPCTLCSLQAAEDDWVEVLAVNLSPQCSPAELFASA